MVQPSKDERGTVSRRVLLTGTAGAAGVVVASAAAANAMDRSTDELAKRVAGSAVAESSGRAARLTEPNSTFFSTVDLEYAASVWSDSDGDLWPSSWADDDVLYTACGDGTGFPVEEPVLDHRKDVWVQKITGTPETGLAGERLAFAEQVCPVWSDPAQYNRKPTGMLAVRPDGSDHDVLYLAVQDLKYGENAFDDAPAASISRSDDYGVTWQWTETAMFSDWKFTTVFFLDFGKSYSNARAALGAEAATYVYAYGLDFNWRASISNTVEDPTKLYLGRAPIGSVQDLATWEYFSGMNGDRPSWSATFDDRVPVLTDERTEYGITVTSQGSVVYNKPLQRYIYASWTGPTFEFYEAPQPWGPWKLFLHKDFGPAPWFGSNSPTPKNGGYASTIPSKFISEDGLTMWVQSNWFDDGSFHEPDKNYSYSMRKLTVTPYAETTPDNEPNPTRNLAAPETGAVVVDKTTHYGQTQLLNDGKTDVSDDSWDDGDGDLDQWGYTWPKRFNVDRLVYTTGEAFDDGGWFADGLTVQVRQNFQWKDVTNLTVDPAYPNDQTAVPFKAFTFSFDETAGDGIRIVGTPGGTAAFTSIAELEVYYDGRQAK